MAPSAKWNCVSTKKRRRSSPSIKVTSAITNRKKQKSKIRQRLSDLNIPYSRGSANSQTREYVLVGCAKCSLVYDVGMSDAIERLVSLFVRFPGIGPRQASRFVQFLLRSSAATRRELIEAVQSLGASVHQCTQCMRFFSGKEKVCGICTNLERDKSLLAVVASDADLAALEYSHNFRGHYFVLGGTVSLASEKTNNLRIKQLLESIPAHVKNGLKEIILAFPANPEGDATAIQVREQLESRQGLTLPSLKITSLGRGLSTGSELEYADPETLKNALESRR